MNCPLAYSAAKSNGTDLENVHDTRFIRYSAALEGRTKIRGFWT